MPFAAGVRAMSPDPAVLLENSTWKPTMTVTGLDGLPGVGNAGNVLAPRLEVKLSFRLPPTANADAAAAAIRRTLESDPPYGARLRFSSGANSIGWNAPRTEPWLERAVAEGLAAVLRTRGHGHGCRRNDPVHGDAGRALSGARSFW